MKNYLTGIEIEKRLRPVKEELGLVKYCEIKSLIERREERKRKSFYARRKIE